MFFGLFYTICLTGAVIDWTWNNQTPREGDFGSDRDSNRWSLPHQSDTRFIDSLASQLIPVTANTFTIRHRSHMLVWQMPTPGHGQSIKTVPGYPHQLASQIQELHDTPLSQYGRGNVFNCKISPLSLYFRIMKRNCRDPKKHTVQLDGLGQGQACS